MSQNPLCLKCARRENDRSYFECTECGGPLWYPRNVGGKPGNTDMEEAIQLIRANKIPWQKG